jgi:hypothetical protein
MLCTVTHAAQVEDIPVCVPKVKTIAAFKNGLGFVFKTGTVSPKDGWARLDDIPAASLGSLWLGTTVPNNPVTDVLSYKDKAALPAEAVTLSELLGANVGKKVVVSFPLGEMKRVQGTLLSVPSDRKPERELFPAQSSPSAYSGSRISPEIARPAEIVLLRVATNDKPFVLSINKSAIQAIELAEDSKTQTAIEKEVNRLKFHVGNNPADAEVTLAYLEKGIIWSPSYRVNIEKDKSAEISLDAVLANDMEDLENAEVSFVVGYPNFLFADLQSPLTLQQSVGTFVQTLISGGNRDNAGNGRGNFMSQSIAYNTANFDASFRPTAGYTAGQPMPGDSSEDLYFYRKANVTMKKGDRARYIVFNATVPCEHLYQWDIPDSMNVDDRGYRQNQDSRKEPESQVWHVLRLQNTTKQPWTTAPPFTVNGAMPLAQDTLQYTPSGARNTLKLTVATDMRAEQTQTESSRRAVNIEGRSFDEVTVSGKLKVTNWKDKEAGVVIRKSLVGEVLSADSDGKVKRVARKLTSVNPASEIEWEFKLAGSKEKEITYQYKALVSR